MKAKRKRLIVGLTSIVILDFAGLITMIADPDLTSRVIPALAAVQIFGFIAIAAVMVMSRAVQTSTEEANGGSGTTGKALLPWIFGFIALVIFLRVGLELLYIAGKDPHSRSWFVPIALTATGCFFIWQAVLTGRSISRGEAKEGTKGSNPAQ